MAKNRITRSARAIFMLDRITVIIEVVYPNR